MKRGNLSSSQPFFFFPPLQVLPSSFFLSGPLIIGGEQIFQLRAVTGDGISSPMIGAWLVATHCLQPITVPPPPTTLTGVVGSAQISLSWVAPQEWGGGANANFRVVFQPTLTANWACVTNVDVTCKLETPANTDVTIPSTGALELNTG